MRHDEKSWGSARNNGFTLIEIMIAVMIIGILASIALANYYSMKEKAIDASMKADLRGAFVYIEDYHIKNNILPPDLATFNAETDFVLSPGVAWDKFELGMVGGEESLDLVLKHPQSTHLWHANFPGNGTKIEPQ